MVITDGQYLVISLFMLCDLMTEIGIIKKRALTVLTWTSNALECFKQYVFLNTCVWEVVRI